MTHHFHSISSISLLKMLKMSKQSKTPAGSWLGIRMNKWCATHWFPMMKKATNWGPQRQLRWSCSCWLVSSLFQRLDLGILGLSRLRVRWHMVLSGSKTLLRMKDHQNREIHIRIYQWYKWRPEYDRFDIYWYRWKNYMWGTLRDCKTTWVPKLQAGRFRWEN